MNHNFESYIDARNFCSRNELPRSLIWQRMVWMGQFGRCRVWTVSVIKGD